MNDLFKGGVSGVIAGELLRQCLTTGEAAEPKGAILSVLVEADWRRPGFLGEVVRSWSRAEGLARELVSTVLSSSEGRGPLQPKFRARSVVEAALELARPLVLCSVEGCQEVAAVIRELAEAIGGIHIIPALCLEANALRMGGRFADAESVLDRASAWLDPGEKPPEESACFLRSLALLRLDEGRFHEGIALLEKSRRGFDESGDRHEAGSCAALIALARHEHRPSEACLKLVLEGLEEMQEGRCPELVVCAALCASHLLARGGYWQAARLMLDSWEKARSGCPWELWLAGRTRYLLRDFGEAVQLLDVAREDFAARHLDYEGALSTWDLACAMRGGGRALRRKISVLAANVVRRHNLPNCEVILGLFDELLGDQDFSSCEQSRDFFRLLLDTSGLRRHPTRFT